MLLRQGASRASQLVLQSRWLSSDVLPVSDGRGRTLPPRALWGTCDDGHPESSASESCSRGGVISVLDGLVKKGQLLRVDCPHERARLILRMPDAAHVAATRRVFGSASTKILTMDHSHSLTAVAPSNWRFTTSDLEGAL